MPEFTTTRRHFLIATGLPGAGWAHAQTQPYPSRPIILLTNSAAGGQGDLVARTIAQGLKERLGQAVTVENRPGANSTIVTNHGARATPDGYTLLTSGVGSQLPIFSKNNAIDISKVMIPIGGIYSAPFFIFVRANLGISTFQDLVKYSQDNDLKMAVSNASSELGVAMLKSKLPANNTLKFRVIPYKSDVNIVTAMLSDEVDFSFSSAGAFLAHLKSGKVRQLFSATSKRVAAFPDVPTAAEAGVANFLVTFDIGLWAPQGTPPSVIAKLQPALAAVVGGKAFTDRMRSVGSDSWPVDGQEQLRIYNERHQFWQDAAKLTGYQPK